MAGIKLSCDFVECIHHNKDYMSGECKSAGVVSIDSGGMCWIARRMIEDRKTLANTNVVQKSAPHSAIATALNELRCALDFDDIGMVKTNIEQVIDRLNHLSNR